MRSARSAVGFLLALLLLSAPDAEAQRASPTEIWRLTVPEELRGRLFEAVILPGTTDLLAAGPAGPTRLTASGELAPLGWFRTFAEGRELGLSVSFNANGTRVGVLQHDRHALAGFELFDLEGNAIASVLDSRSFIFRVAPDGGSFVGVDAGGQHIPVKAPRFVYHLFDGTGAHVADIASEDPRPFDSAYSADGTLLVINNAAGIEAYGSEDGALRWSAEIPARSFAAANGATGIVAATGEEDRRRVTVLRSGEPVVEYQLEGNGSRVAVSSNGQFVLATDGRTAYLLTPTSTEAIARIAPPDPGFSIRSIAVNDAGMALIGAQHEGQKSGTVFIADLEGRIVYRTDMPLELANARVPAVELNPAGDMALLRSLEQLILVDLR